MKNRSYTSLVVTLLIVGLANAAAFLWGFWMIAVTIQSTTFGSSYTQRTQSVVALSNDRFAVVKDGYGESIGVVYQVDAKGTITRLSDVGTQYKALTPVARSTPYAPPATATTPPQTPTPDSLESRTAKKKIASTRARRCAKIKRAL